MSQAQHVTPDFQDWLSDERKDFLTSKLFPLSSLLLQADLLDKFLLFWLDREIAFDVKSIISPRDKDSP